MKLLAALLFAAGALLAQSAENVLLVVNESSAISRRISDYYVHRRGIPLANVCKLKVTEEEVIDWTTYEQKIERPIADCLKPPGRREKILYIATTLGVPLKVTGPGSGFQGEYCSVDSELTLLYSKLRGAKFQRAGMVPNPFFRKRDQPFRHPAFPIYLVARLAGYDFEDVKGLIDRSLAARNRGKFVIDLKSADDANGNNWLRTAAMLLPPDRVVLDESTKVLTDQREVIGYAAWGSNDRNRKQRHLGFQWLPGAIATEYVSLNGRTFKKPPDDWNISTWAEKDKDRWFAGAPQTMTADYIHDGATACSGHVYEPYLGTTPRPEYLLPAYLDGRTVAESYWLSIPALSWQSVVVGDPLCRLGKP